MMLSAGVHTGTRNSDSGMEEYIWRRRRDGLHILNIGKTWEKIMLAARVIVAIENPEDVVAISALSFHRASGRRALRDRSRRSLARARRRRHQPRTQSSFARRLRARRPPSERRRRRARS